MIKRNGVEVPFDKNKIINAIKKAFLEVDTILFDTSIGIALQIANQIENAYFEGMTVEDIQDIVEESLMASQRFDVARAYIRYRYKREVARNQNSEFMKAITEKLEASNVENQNANIDEMSFGGRKGEASNVLMKQYALDYCVSDMSRNNHLNNEIYNHDLDNYAVGCHNCLTIPFDDLLKKGFNTRQTDVRSAQSINTSFQLLAVIFQLQSLQQFGGVASSHLDWTMVPYVRKSFSKHFVDGLKYCENKKENEYEVPSELSIEEAKEKYPHDKIAYDYALAMTKRELNQAVEGMFHNLNTLQSRSGNQLPFTSINYGTCTLPEGRMVTKAILQGSIKGVGKLHRTSVFPCQIFQCMKGVNREPGDPNYDLYRLALKSTAQRLYPNYANCDFSGQLDWVKYDRNNKKEVIDNLTQEQKDSLMIELIFNPKLKDSLFLDITDEKELAIKEEQKPYEIMSTMGCRTQNGADINAKACYEENINSVLRYGKLSSDILSAAQKDGRGNICPVTIILPTIAMEALYSILNANESIKAYEDYKKDKFNIFETLASVAENPSIIIETFMTLLDNKIHEAKDMLLERFEFISSQPAESAKFMYENNAMAGYDKKTIRSALSHGTLALGQLGLAECLQILIGKDHTTAEGMELAKRIEQLFKDRCSQFKEQYKLNFGVYYSPAENLCYTAMKKFKEKYGEIPNVSDKEFFTNSIHVPVWKKMSPFDKIDIESQLVGYSSAGCITYVELDGGVKNNIDAIETIVNYAMDHDIPYFAINVPNDTCLDCGYCDEFNDHCPECGSKHIQQLRRVTGYLTGNYKTAFNRGKIEETENRVKHTGGLEA